MSILNGFDEDLESVDFTLSPEEIKLQLSSMAGERAVGLVNKNKQMKGLLDAKGEGKAVTDAERERIATLEKFKSDSELLAEENAKNYQQAKQNIIDTNEKALSAKDAEYQALNGQYRALVVDGAITSELVGLDVSKELMPMVQVALAAKAEIIDGKAVIDGQPLSEYMKAWGESPTGKASRAAPQNQGGDGGNPATTPTSIKGKAWSELKTVAEKAAYLEAKG